MINRVLVELGLRHNHLPGESLVYRSYELFGENLVGIAMARLAARAVRGWSVSRARAAGEQAGMELEAEVARYAGGLLAEHREAGHLLVLATTTPHDLVAPLARRLGFDHLVATRYEVRDGVYTGSLDGRFVWGRGKLDSVRELAQRTGVDLKESFAYSDSLYDLPLLSAVGHPFAANPDAGLLAVALAKRWPVVHLDSPPGVPTIGGAETFDVAKRLVRPELFPYARFDLTGLEHLPKSGGFLLVSNHRSYFDVAALAVAIAKSGRRTRFLAKQELFDAPVVGHIARALGGIPVAREAAAADALVAARRALDAGEGVVILPEGTIPRGRAFFDPVLQGKTGAARLAAATRVPVVPVGLTNTEAVWPRSSRLPSMMKVVGAPRVKVRVGPPVRGLRLGATDAVSDTKKIMAAIARLVDGPVRAVSAVTEEELARTYPPGRYREEPGVRTTASREERP